MFFYIISVPKHPSGFIAVLGGAGSQPTAYSQRSGVRSGAIGMNALPQTVNSMGLVSGQPMPYHGSPASSQPAADGGVLNDDLEYQDPVFEKVRKAQDSADVETVTQLETSRPFDPLADKSGAKRTASDELREDVSLKVARRIEINWSLVKSVFEGLLELQQNSPLPSKKVWECVRNSVLRREKKAYIETHGEGGGESVCRQTVSKLAGKLETFEMVQAFEVPPGPMLRTCRQQKVYIHRGQVFEILHDVYHKCDTPHQVEEVFGGKTGL